jgi:hypothetical protein
LEQAHIPDRKVKVDRLGLLWKRLIEPGENYPDIDDYRRAKLFSTILVLLFPVITIVGLLLMPAINSSKIYWQNPTVLPASSALVGSLISYTLNRMGYFKVASYLYIIVFVFAPYYAMIANFSLDNISIGTLMVGGVFLTTALFSNLALSILILVIVVGLILMVPWINPAVELTNVGALASANLTIGLLIALYSYYRNGLEIFRHSQLTNLNKMLRESYSATLEGWARALELQDKETEGHSRRVTELSMALGEKLGLSEEKINAIYYGALLHDIGKLGIPETILNKPGSLTEKERELIECHPMYAYELLKDVDFLQEALAIPQSHHENWDGSGYPQGLQGEEIPLIARLFSVIDVWDALTSERPYRMPWTREKSIEYLQKQSGIIFDPLIVEVFLKEVVPEK